MNDCQPTTGHMPYSANFTGTMRTVCPKTFDINILCRKILNLTQWSWTVYLLNIISFIHSNLKQNFKDLLILWPISQVFNMCASCDTAQVMSVVKFLPNTLWRSPVTLSSAEMILCLSSLIVTGMAWWSSKSSSSRRPSVENDRVGCKKASSCCTTMPSLTRPTWPGNGLIERFGWEVLHPPPHSPDTAP